MTVVVTLIWPVGRASATPSAEEDVGVGFWQLHDASATSMSVQGIDGPGKTTTALVAVTQRFCDAASDQAVSRTIFAQADVDPGEFVVQPQLDQARLATTVTARIVDN
jgi:hypothetical protein